MDTVHDSDTGEHCHLITADDMAAALGGLRAPAAALPVDWDLAERCRDHVETLTGHRPRHLIYALPED